MIFNTKDRPIDLTESSREAKKSKVSSCDFPSRTIFPNTTSQPIMHPDEYEIMANYFSNDFEEQMGFFKIMADLDNEPFLPLVKNISFLSTDITDKQWITYHKKLGLTQTPRTLIVTCFTKTTEKLQELLLLTPYLKTLKFCDKKRKPLFEQFAYNRIVYPPNLENLMFDKYSDFFDYQLAHLPLQKLIVGKQFNSDFDKVVLPACLESLTFGKDFNQRIGKTQLKFCSLKELVFGDRFDHPLTCVELPKTLETLVFGFDYSGDINEYDVDLRYTPNLKNLTFGYSFNSDVFYNAVLPDTLETLTFGRFFNQPLRRDQLVKTSLKKLIFGDHFDSPSFRFVELPKTLEILEFGKDFNHPLDNNQICNTSLHSLIFGARFHGCEHVNNIQGILVNNNVFKHVVLPPTLRKLCVSGGTILGSNQLMCTSLTHLTYGGANHRINNENYYYTHFSKVKLPSTLKVLEFTYGFNAELYCQQFSTLQLEYLKFHGDYNKVIFLEAFCKPDVQVFTLNISKNYGLPLVFPNNRQVILIPNRNDRSGTQKFILSSIV